MTLPRSSVQLSLAAVAWCGDFGRPTLLKAAIAFDFKLTFKFNDLILLFVILWCTSAIVVNLLICTATYR